jgi:hypothetical protein
MRIITFGGLRLNLLAEPSASASASYRGEAGPQRAAAGMPFGPVGRSRLGKGLRASSRRTEEHMATLRERIRSFTIWMSECDLRMIEKHGYEGALSTDHQQQAQAVSRFITDALAARLDR